MASDNGHKEAVHVLVSAGCALNEERRGEERRYF
jgi:hypothetical protein